MIELDFLIALIIVFLVVNWNDRRKIRNQRKVIGTYMKDAVENTMKARVGIPGYKYEGTTSYSCDERIAAEIKQAQMPLGVLKELMCPYCNEIIGKKYIKDETKEAGE